MTAPAADPTEPNPERPSRGARQGLAAQRSLEVCPLLRSSDGSWSSAVASRELRCWAVQPAALPTLVKQRQLCVSARHAECPTYLAASAADTAIPTRDETAGSLLWPSSTPVPIALEAPHARAGDGLPFPRTGGQAMLIGLMLVAFLVLVIAKTPLGGGTAGPSLGPSAPAASSIALTSPSASPTASPTAEPTPSASPSPSVTPSPSPAASPRTYKVRSGDTLAVIAAKFHTTVKAIVAANNISDPRTIHPGQTLVIP